MTGNLPSASTWHGDTLDLNDLESEGDHAGAVLGFKTGRGDKINVKVASSFISPEQAMLNLTREIGERILRQLKKREGMHGTNS